MVGSMVSELALLEVPFHSSSSSSSHTLLILLTITTTTKPDNANFFI